MGRDEGLSTPNEPRLQGILFETIVEQILNEGLLSETSYAGFFIIIFFQIHSC